jgi:hypothetical protein
MDTPKTMTPQQIFADLQELKKQSDAIALLTNEKLTQFLVLHGDYEYPVVDEGKPKWARVFAPKGQFVYNKTWELGLRAKPEKPYPLADGGAEPSSAKDLPLGPVIV